MHTREIIELVVFVAIAFMAPFADEAVLHLHAAAPPKWMADSELAAIVGSAECECKRVACGISSPPVGCTSDPGAIFRKCYGCDSPYTTSHGQRDRCMKKSGSGCCSASDCGPNCDYNDCTTKTWTSNKKCSNSTPNCSVGNPCNYQVQP